MQPSRYYLYYICLQQTTNMLLMKKQISHLLIACLLVVLIGSCRPQDYTIEYFPYRTEKSAFWGMMSPKGTPLFEGRFMNPPSISTRGVFLVQEEDGYYAFYTTTEKTQRINEYNYVMAKPFLLSNYTPVLKQGDNSFTIIDIKGNTVATLPDNVADIGFFANGLAPFVTDSIAPRMGYVDTHGQVAIPARYSLATNFVCGVALVEEIIKGIPSVSVIDPKGNTIYTFGNEWQPLATEYSDGLLPIINIRQEIAFLDTHGQVAIPPQEHLHMCMPNNPATIPYTFKAGHCIYSDGMYYGIIDKRGKIVVPAQYLNLYLGEGGLFAAEDRHHNWGCINSQGKVIIPFEHFPGVIKPSITPHCIVMQNEAQRYRLINDKGKVISKPFTNYQAQ